MIKMNEKTTKFEVNPIGSVQKTNEGFSIQVNEPFRPGLRQLEHFSHVIVVWWADKHDNQESRSKITTTPPYADKLTGVFACRAEYRPNPIAVTTCKILEVDEQKGVIKVPWIDAYSGTPVLDLKAYFPVCDRVKEARIPEWLKGWPEWMPEEMNFESD